MASRKQRYIASRGKAAALPLLPAAIAGARIAAPYVARGAMVAAPYIAKGARALFNKKNLKAVGHHLLPHLAVHGVVTGAEAAAKHARRKWQRDRNGKFAGFAAASPVAPIAAAATKATMHVAAAAWPHVKKLASQLGVKVLKVAHDNTIGDLVKFTIVVEASRRTLMLFKSAVDLVTSFRKQPAASFSMESCCMTRKQRYLQSRGAEMGIAHSVGRAVGGAATYAQRKFIGHKVNQIKAVGRGYKRVGQSIASGVKGLYHGATGASMSEGGKACSRKQRYMKSKSAKMSVAGGIAGTAIGTVVGGAIGHPIAGAVAGGAIGHQITKPKKPKKTPAHVSVHVEQPEAKSPKPATAAASFRSR